MPSSHASRAARRVVLDSNVWIDILVFDDPDTRPIRAALESGALEALIDARCLAELTYVLDYPQFVRREVALAVMAVPFAWPSFAWHARTIVIGGIGRW